MKQSKGITLVALVITVIILLILATISIQSLTNTGLFKNAQEAKNAMENAQKEESRILTNYLAQMNSITFINVDKNKTNPESAMPKDAIVIEGDANKGIVIKDSKENDWVWVEVPKDITAEKKTDNDIEKALHNYAIDYREGSSGQEKNWIDEWYNGCGIEEDKYNTIKSKMLQSIKINGGFWISRYEVGDETETTTNTTRSNKSGINGTPVSKANQIPYTFVTCSQAQKLATKMSTDDNKTSSLLFGIQWDLTCKFLQEKGGLSVSQLKSGDNEGSTNWGNYWNSKLKLYRGKYTIAPWNTNNKWVSYTINTENYVNDSQTLNNEKQLLTTGASEETNKMNIYDFAGNVWEWTLEHATSDTSKPCAIRGGCFNNYGYHDPASMRHLYTIDQSGYFAGFRSALY